MLILDMSWDNMQAIETDAQTYPAPYQPMPVRRMVGALWEYRVV